MGSSELGRQWPQAALQESLQTSPPRRHVHPGAAALGVLCEEEEADGKKLSGQSCSDANHDFCNKTKIPGISTRCTQWFKILVWLIEIFVFTLTWQDNINKNYHSIRLRPDQFSSYLTTEVGFTSFEHLGAPKCSIRGNSLICQSKFTHHMLFITVTWCHFLTFHLQKVFRGLSTYFTNDLSCLEDLWMWVA